ncbi:uncharacterized protein FFUJ_04157 [Fusarium fujikuroi IMI 58289]|uniref:Uncharacterized protein n=1 Tax=Gibberella fujikuroi (strain CBS 195.34 / IMI 58289 / NRRL A-6831) TaxID=1279085 RepID=S0DRC2_GIBF5|nr:uncharacterized protein FFUJ_04157 [Fusarium fujikuroi IMI 58289]CCT65109.1 uncharacterized protein FFUJ_04157 [Fusarium fujikuroi IMI 58289]
MFVTPSYACTHSLHRRFSALSPTNSQHVSDRTTAESTTRASIQRIFLYFNYCTWAALSPSDSPPLNSGLPPPHSQPPDTTPDNGTGNCIQVLVESKEAETEVVEEQEQDDDTTKTISPPPEATADFKSTVKAIFLRLIALPGDLRAVDQNQASTACQPSS